MKGGVVRTLALLCLLTLALPNALAQDDPFAGVTIESLGAASPAVAPGHALVFLRLTLQPGAHIASHSHPGDVILVVERGAFTTAFTQGEGTLTRVGAEPAAIVTGSVETLHPGDSLAYDGSAGHTMVNEGDEPLVLLVSALLDGEQDGFLFHQD